METLTKERLEKNLNNLFFRATCGGTFVNSKLQRQKDSLQQAINELEEYRKYIPDIDKLKDWCKGDYLQKEGYKLKVGALK